MIFRTRFAPSPTGPLHLGHAYSACLAHDMARAAGGVFQLRIEDIDRSRARPHWEAQIFDDLAWLGLSWEEPVLRQSDRQPVYARALDGLWARGLLYPCHCSRADIQAAVAAPQEGAAPAYGPDGLIYPGTCRPDDAALPELTQPPKNLPLRLNMRRAVRAVSDRCLRFTETGAGPQAQTGAIRIDPQSLITDVGDVVLSRRDFAGSYHLSVVLDDAEQTISHVVRGNDLYEATQIHVLLQHLLGLPTPIYHHHPLIRDETGKRLAKRDDARAIAFYRETGASPRDIRAMVHL